MSTREIKALWDSINAGNYKQVVVKINKELKKTPNHPYWEALAGYVACKQHKRQEALNYVDGVASSGPTNVTVIALLQDVYVHYGMDQEMTSLFETAARKSHDVDVLDLWADAVIDRGYIRGFLKMSMAQQKANGTRASALQAAFAMYLAFNSRTTAESEKKIFPMLASRMLEKAEPCKSAQECYVRALVLGMSDQNKVVVYLQSEPVRALGSLDLTVMLLETLNKLENWKSLFEECVSFLSTGVMDNWLHWESMNKSARKLGHHYVERANQFIRSFEPPSRNSRLARVDLCATADDLMEALKSYMDKIGTKRCAFEDLEKYVQTGGFDVDQFILWLEGHENYRKDLNWQVNTTRFKYMLLNGPDCVDSNIQLYNRSKPALATKDPKDYHSGNDFLLISATALLQSNDEFRVEKAAVLLETASMADKHQFYVRLWLVRIYLLLGALTKANGHYTSLSIKMVQNETLSHIIATRCSTLHPSRDTLKSTQDIYGQKGELTPFIKHALSKSVYTQIEGFMDLNRKLKNSLNERLLEIEKVRIERLHGAAVNLSRLDELNVGVDELEDNRDFTTMWNCQKAATVPLSDALTIGPRPGATWVKANLLKEQIIKRLVSADNLISLSRDLRELVTSGNEEFTAEEIWSFGVIIQLVESAEKKESIQSYHSVGEKLRTISMDAVDPNQWLWMHRAFTIAEACCVVSGYVAGLKASRHHIKSNVKGCDDLLHVAKEVLKNVQDQALVVKNQRAQRFRTVVDMVGPWAEERGISTSFVENIIDGIGATKEKSLTVLRGIKL
jgi:N-terminal acetyltransferase B complex non-catalytic subunit